MIQRSSGIVWIASYPRSGNTWTRIFLYHLAQVLSGSRDQSDINDLQKFSPWDADVTMLSKFTGGEVSDLNKIGSARHLAHREMAEGRNGIIFTKTHWPVAKVLDTYTFDFSVSAGAIYCVRNPLDVAISLSHHLDKSIDHTIKLMGTPAGSFVAEGLAELWGSWSENVKSWTENVPIDISILRYEDLLENPKLWFTIVARNLFKTIPTNDQIYEAIDRSSFDKLRDQEMKRGFVEKMPGRVFFREGRSGQWESILTPQQINTIVRDHQAQMERFGYLP